MCLFSSPKVQTASPTAPISAPTIATNADVDTDDIYKKMRQKKGTSWLTRSTDRGTTGSILSAATDQAANSQKQTLG